MRRYVGASAAPSNCSDALTTPSTRLASSLSVPRCVVATVIVPRAGAQIDGQAVIDTLRAQLAHFKVPKRCYVVDSLPRNTMGKVQKKLLRDQYAREFA